MTIQIELPQEIEHQLQALSQGSQSAIHSYILEAVKSRLQQLPDNQVAQEAALLERINTGFSETFWQQYHHLVEKKANETITQPQLDVLIDMTNQIEAANARRLEAAYQLALLRKKEPKQLMQELGLVKNVYTA